MKKIPLILVLMLLSALLAGCQGQQAPARTPVELAQQYEQVKQGPGTDSPAVPPIGAGPSPVPLQDPPHLDISGMSYPMAYGQVYSMVMAPKRHQGQTLQIKGSYYGFQTAEGEEVHLILITDEAGCCEVGMEFVITGSPAWPQDFPPNNSIILLTGLMDTISHGDNLFPLLVANEIQVVQAAGTP